MTASEPARADLWGGDLPLLTGILAEAVTEVTNLGNMLTQLVAEVNLMRTMLAGVDSGSFSALLGVIRTTSTTASTLTAGIHALTYTLNQIDGQFTELFPSDPAGASFQQHAQYVDAWNREVLSASQIAARQQTALEALDQSTAAAEAVLRQSQSASGDLAQLQLVVQMLGIVHAQLGTIHQTLATSGRVLTDMAAASASSSQLSQAKKAASLAGYTDRGPAVSVPSRLP